MKKVRLETKVSEHNSWMSFKSKRFFKAMESIPNFDEKLRSIIVSINYKHITN